METLGEVTSPDCQKCYESKVVAANNPFANGKLSPGLF